MQAIILDKTKDITLYNGETSKERIIRLLNKNNIKYEVLNEIPSIINKPTLIIYNNLVFNELLLKKYINQDNIINLYEDNINNLYRIQSNYNKEFISIINEDNKYIINKELRIYDLVNQNIIITDNYFRELSKLIKPNEKVFVVSSKSQLENIEKQISLITKNYIIFSDFSSNPAYEDIIIGSKLFMDNKCNTIIAIGGGSSIDTAKCIKAFTNIKDENDVINKNYKYSDINLIAIPTTSGTGSESTEVAVMYYKGEKLSVDHPSDLPNTAILDYNFLITLPEYQKKCVMLDALCQLIEAYWSTLRTDLSKSYSEKGIKLILANYKGYLNNNPIALRNISIAANYSGKAITLAKTTAPHTMCYRLTTKYNIAHGHAVTLTLIYNWRLIAKENNQDIKNMLLNLANIIGFNNIEDSIDYISNIIKEMNLKKPIFKKEDIDYLIDGVDLKRLYNHPIKLNKDDLYCIYEDIIRR